MQPKKSLADFWSFVFLFFAGLMLYFAAVEPQANIAQAYRIIAYVCLGLFVLAIVLCRWLLGAFFSNLSGGR